MIIPTIPAAQVTREQFLEIFNRDGCVVVEDVFSEAQMDAILPELERAIQAEASLQPEKEHKDFGMLLACPVYGGHFLDVLEHRPYFKPFHWLLGDTCIIWVYTSSSIPPQQQNYAARIHVDRAHFVPGFLEGMGSLILLDDFTEANGGTWVLRGSQHRPDEPAEEEFYRQADRLVARKGSVFYFNLRLWHAGGFNASEQWRHSLGIGMIRPYMKQRIDLPRAMRPEDVSKLSDFARQKLGFFAQPPASVAEYYRNTALLAKLQPSEWEKNKDQ